MTNRATSLLYVDLVPWAGKRCPIQVDMERVMAKLQIGVASNSFELSHNGTKYADVNITNYKLVNLNRQYYLFQHRDFMSSLGQPAFVFPDSYDEYTYGDSEYVVDPLFYKKMSDDADITQFRSLYESWYGTFSTENFASMPVAGNHTGREQGKRAGARRAGNLFRRPAEELRHQEMLFQYGCLRNLLHLLDTAPTK